MKRHLFLIIACCFLIAKGENTNIASYYFMRINGESGLSQINVKSITQDSYGFMWFGTRNKLNRYDGTRIKIYDCYDPVLRVGNNNISALYEDKNKKLWVGTDKGIYIFDPVFEKFTFFNDSTISKIKITDWVSDIQEDLDGNIWIVIPNEGLFRFHVSANQLFHYAIGDTKMPNQGGNPQSMCIEKNGVVWVGTNGDGVYRYDKKKDSFTQYIGTNEGLRNENIYTMCDYGDELVLGVHEGRLRKLNKRRNTLTDVKAPEVHYKIIRDVKFTDNRLWVGTEAGLFIVNESENSVIHLQEDPMYPYSLSDNVVEKIYKDRENGIWVGTRFGGANYLAKKGINFECYVPLRNSNNSITGRRLREIKEDTNGNIWIASEETGLDIFDLKKKEFRQIDKVKGIQRYKNSKILGLLLDNNQAWIGFFKNGLDVIQLPQFNIRHYSGEDLNLDETSIYEICEDRYGKIWLGNGWGVFVGDKEKKDFKRTDKFGLSYIYDIIEDSKGYIWVATLGNGVFRYNQTTDELFHYLHDINDSLSLSSNSVSDITETSLGEIWLSTDRGGICGYNDQTNNFTSFSVKNGLPDNITYKIVEDKDNYLWFGTNAGLVKFDPKNEKVVKVFSKNNGLPIDEFNYKSALAASDGKLYFGGLSGLVAFDPYNFEENKFIPPIYITQLSIFNEEIGLNTKNTPLKRSISYTEKITLNYNQSNIGFNFVALSFTAPKANRYAYIMEGVDNDWIYTNNNQTATYAKIPPGKYVFKVKGSNNDGLWNEEGASLEIEILPPWWQTSFAYFCYITLFLLLVYYSLNRYLKRLKKRQAEQQKIFETEKEKELYNSKVEFFTNVAHEIRTPITLINGPLEAIQDMGIEDPEIKKCLSIMSKSTSELLNLVNQLLDFRKIDSNKFLLNIMPYNITELLKEIFHRFELSANQQGKTIKILLSSNEDIIFPFDKEALTKIFNNLLTNALRYSDKYIEIELSTENNFVNIKIRNDGELILPELHEKIFDPFYQGDKNRNNPSSSGIGLSLVKSLTELHHGQISYHEYNGLNEFIVQLPITTKFEIENNEKIPENDYLIAENESADNKQDGGEIILLVEDNKEMLNFIAGRLKKQFVVEKATNGIEALKVLEEKSVSLVLTDVMMPEMDGFELCKSVKNNIDYSNIPVVLITGKNDLESKILGLQMGADAYVEKPFSMSHLITQLTTLLNNRRREREAFLRKPFLSIQNIGMTKADEEFMQKVIDIIDENITDPDFNVERLSEKVFMSRSNLHRKIKALTELTTIDFIHLIRLKKSAELIQSGKYRISEVCYLVGINSPSYFIKLFQKQFGMTPKEFSKQQQ